MIDRIFVIWWGGAAGAPDHVNAALFSGFNCLDEKAAVREVWATPEPTGRTGTRTHARTHP